MSKCIVGKNEITVPALRPVNNSTNTSQPQIPQEILNLTVTYK